MHFILMAASEKKFHAFTHHIEAIYFISGYACDTYCIPEVKL